MNKKVIILILAAIVSIGLFAVNQHNAGANVNSQQKMAYTKTQVRASHILVNSEAQAIRLKSQIENGDISFEDAAKKYSLCPSGQNGGDLGYFGRGVMVKEFEDAALTIPKGKVSTPVKTQFGYLLITVTGTK